MLLELWSSNRYLRDIVKEKIKQIWVALFSLQSQKKGANQEVTKTLIRLPGK